MYERILLPKNYVMSEECEYDQYVRIRYGTNASIKWNKKFVNFLNLNSNKLLPVARESDANIIQLVYNSENSQDNILITFKMGNGFVICPQTVKDIQLHYGFQNLQILNKLNSTITLEKKQKKISL